MPHSTQVLWITINKEVCVTLYALLAVFDNRVGEVWFGGTGLAESEEGWC